MVKSETMQVTGIRCERCVLRLGGALGELDGLESAHANLLGELTLAWNDEVVQKDQILVALARAGFQPVADS
jgi:copper chaperone CopZ